MTIQRHYPNSRLRRTRASTFIRSMVQENHLRPEDLILPIFVQEGQQITTPISSLPNTARLSIDKAVEVAQEAYDLGIQALALFPVIDTPLKSLDASEAYNPNGLMQRAIREIKAKCPDIGLIGDVALDPYTTHGQDGIIDEHGMVVNDITVEVLQKQALAQAEAGIDIVAPSDMMDGRIGAIRETLESNDFHNTLILSYAAKYASSFYGPFRDAVGSSAQLGKSDKKSYQLNPANGQEALHEITMDACEGADMLMVKPGMPYLDILWRVKEASQMPTLVNKVSGE